MNRKKVSSKHRPFRRAVLRGLGVVLPPLLTIVILLWIGQTIQQYVLEPVETQARRSITWTINKTQRNVPPGAEWIQDAGGSSERRFRHEDTVYVQLRTGHWIPETIRDDVLGDPGQTIPATGKGYYERYVQILFLKWSVIIKAVFLCGFILVLYLLGKFLAAGVGRILWNSFEQIIAALPIIRTVYSSVKQVTDFIFSEREIEYTRVVAVEYPRKGIWSLGFVTGESMESIRHAAQEPVMSVLIPTSPMPATGFTITVRKSETVELGITVDEAFQFIVSCGVVVPLMEDDGDIEGEITAAVDSRRTRSRARSSSLLAICRPACAMPTCSLAAPKEASASYTSILT
jgi:uncharacterized membrane protein